jgi:hypothetical protein
VDEGSPVEYKEPVLVISPFFGELIAGAGSCSACGLGGIGCRELAAREGRG